MNPAQDPIILDPAFWFWDWKCKKVNIYFSVTEPPLFKVAPAVVGPVADFGSDQIRSAPALAPGCSDTGSGSKQWICHFQLWISSLLISLFGIHLSLKFDWIHAKCKNKTFFYFLLKMQPEPTDQKNFSVTGFRTALKMAAPAPQHWFISFATLELPDPTT